MIKKISLAVGIFIMLLSLTTSGLACGNKQVHSSELNPDETQEPVELHPLTAQELEEQWGIQLIEARLTADDGLIDLRFKVTDPEKAIGLEGSLQKSIIVEESSGRYTWIATTSKVGSLKDINLTLPDRVNYMLYMNSGKMIKTGSTIVLVAGELHLGRLTVK